MIKPKMAYERSHGRVESIYSRSISFSINLLFDQ